MRRSEGGRDRTLELPLINGFGDAIPAMARATRLSSSQPVTPLSAM